MTATRLVGFEAAAIRYADDMSDDQLAQLLSARIEFVTGSTEQPERVRAQDLRELAAAALITARRMDSRQQDYTPPYEQGYRP